MYDRVYFVPVKGIPYWGRTTERFLDLIGLGVFRCLRKVFAISQWDLGSEGMCYRPMPSLGFK